MQKGFLIIYEYIFVVCERNYHTPSIHNALFKKVIICVKIYHLALLNNKIKLQTKILFDWCRNEGYLTKDFRIRVQFGVRDDSQFRYEENSRE